MESQSRGQCSAGAWPAVTVTARAAGVGPAAPGLKFGVALARPGPRPPPGRARAACLEAWYELESLLPRPRLSSDFSLPLPPRHSFTEVNPAIRELAGAAGSASGEGLC